MELVPCGVFVGCGCGQRRAGERLLATGVDLNWELGYADGTPLDAAERLDTRMELVSHG